MKPVESLITVGRIVQSRGIRGEVVVYPLSDDPARFESFDYLLAVSRNGVTTRLEVEQVDIRTRHGRQEVLLRFKNIESRTDSDALKGAELLIEQDILRLEEDEYFLFDLVGVAVETEDGQVIGSIKEVRRMPAQDLFVIVRDAGEEVLIPDVPEFVDKSHLDDGKLLVRPIEGLLES